MKVLLIGGTGRLSKDTTALCIKRGYDVYLINRGNKNAFHESNVHYLIGNIKDRASTLQAIGDETFDVVVDYLTYDLPALKSKLEIFQNRTKQYIFISSATVYPIQDGCITEKSSIGNDGWLYAKNKRLCEEYLREHGESFSFPYTIVRPYVTYDTRRIPFPVISKMSCWNLLYRIDNGLPILMPGDGEQREHLTSSVDFAVGITGLFMNPKAFGEDFNIVGDEVATWNQVVRSLEAALHQKAHVVYVEPEKLASEIPALRAELLYDKAYPHAFDNSKLKEAVPAFQTTIDIQRGMAMTVSYLQEHPEEQVVDDYWNAMESILCRKYGYKDISVGLSQRWLYYRTNSKALKRIRRIMK